MQAYKMRKTTETVLYPIEDELRQIREGNEKSWRRLLWQIFSIVFSGIGTTLLCQDDLLPSVVIGIYCKIKKMNIEQVTMNWKIFVLEFLIALALFLLLCVLSAWLIGLCDKNKDNKRNDIKRKNTAEYFHKVIFNNVITGVSFIKKVNECEKEAEERRERLRNETDDKEKAYCEEIVNNCEQEKILYVSEAIYYFKTANHQIDEEYIFEHSFSKKYEKFLDEVGIVALDKFLDMYEKAILELKELNSDKRNTSVIDEIQRKHSGYRDNYDDNLEKIKNRDIEKEF